MLGNRYKNDGQPGIPLNPLQVSLRDGIQKKVEDGVYEFESVDCAVCGETNFETIAEKDRYGLYFPVVICPKCGLIFSNPRMTQQSYAQFYDCEYRQLYYGKEHPMDDLFLKGMQRGKRIANFLGQAEIDLNGKKVLEVGCGAGGILAYLQEKFQCEVAGCDFGSEGVQHGVNEHGLNLKVGSLESIELPWKPDLIIYAHVFEHILDLDAECQRIREILGDDGTVYLEVPSTRGIRENYNWDFLTLLQNAHTYHFTLTTLTNVMRKNGFALITGDEFTRSAFRKSGAAQSEVNYDNDYDSVMEFLQTTERNRVVGQFKNRLRRLPRQLKNTCLASAIWCLERLGVKEILKKTLGR